eukprot:TRINITY_DN2360_c0_g1_i1.p1 TRINITY_DN2360_c0_g1~~TRINITY_DN2360_c0_g1_i1.p1  ORF type:complete len:503 (-),score=106.98 TRINITY_DN2360_c0_g1_i1:244-1752(-)
MLLLARRSRPWALRGATARTAPALHRRFCSVTPLAAPRGEELDADRRGGSHTPGSGSGNGLVAVAPGEVRRPTVHDPPKVLRPSEFVDIATVIRNWWAFPAVGFNSILEIPVQKLETFTPGDPGIAGKVTVPNSIFGVPIRKDMIYKVYWWHRRALAGYCSTMQLYKWDWPGSNKKVRSQKKSGKGRMGRRKAPARWDGSFTHALRPRDWRQRLPRRMIWKALKSMLSAKYVQNTIKVVDSFNLQSHKTKHLVKHLRRIVGTNCRSAMLVHEGNHDVNDNFRWASAHISQIHRQNVEGVSVYNLLKYHQLVITELALTKLIAEIQGYPRKMKWGPRNATPDGRPAPIPEKVPGWNNDWVEKKERLRNSEFRAREFFREQQKWKWSSELKGALKLPRTDTLASFRVKDFLLEPEKPMWEKLESLYVDDEPLEEEPEDEEFSELVETLEAAHELGESKRTDLIEDRSEIERQGLATLARAGGGRRASRQRASADGDATDPSATK